jgi:hypothetical protein
MEIQAISRFLYPGGITMPDVVAEVKNTQRIREAAAGAIRSPYEAISQYVANSIGSYRRMEDPGRKEVIIELHRRREGRQVVLDTIIIEDYAEGMTQEKMEALPRSMGASEHANDPKSNSFFQLGHLSFMVIGEGCLYQSRDYQSREMSSLRLRADSPVASANEDLEDRLFEGTRVTISGIIPEYRKGKLTAGLLKLALADKFRGSIGTDVRITIGEYLNGDLERSVLVDKEPYSGTQLVDSQIKVQGIDDARVLIHYNPTSRNPGAVALMHNGEVYGQISGSVMDDHGLWTTPGLSGEISFDSAIPNTSKTGIVYKGKKYEQFKAGVIKKLEPIIKREIGELKNRHITMENQRLYDKINDALSVAISNLPLEPPFGLSQGRKRSFTSRSLQNLVDPSELQRQIEIEETDLPTVSDLIGYDIAEYLKHDGGIEIPNDAMVHLLDLFPGLQRGRKKFQKNTEREEKPIGDGLPVGVKSNPDISASTRKAPISIPRDGPGGTKTPKLNFLEESLGDPSEYARADWELGIVYVNTDHPDYQGEVTAGRGHQKAIYFAKLTSAQIIKHQLSELSAGVQMDMMLTLQIAMERQLRSG